MEIAAVLEEPSASLPEPAAKAFRNWPTVSVSLHDLFERAPREAFTDPDAALACMTLKEIGRGGYPESAAAVVRERAEHMLTECAKRNRRFVEKAIEEPRRLVKVMDEFVALFNNRMLCPHPSPLPEGEGVKIVADEAERHARDFLDNCRRLDRALSEIPRRLQQGEVARETSDA